MVTREYEKLIKSLYKMDGYILQRIVLYVKEASIVKLMFYIQEYRDLISESDYHYDELVKDYSNKDWNTDNLRMIKSLYRLKITIWEHRQPIQNQPIWLLQRKEVYFQVLDPYEGHFLNGSI